MALLQYDLAVVGQDKVNAALASIERRFAQHNARVQATIAKGRAETKAARQVDRGRPTPVSDAAKQAVVGDRQATKERDRLDRYREMVRRNSLRREEQERVKTERVQERQSRAAAVAQERQRRQAERRQVIDRAAAERKLAADAAKVERQKAIQAKLEASEQLRLERHREALRRTSLRQEEMQRKGQWASEERHATRVAHQRAAFTKATLGNAADRVTGTLRAVGTTGAAMLGIGGAGMAFSAVSGAARLDEITRRLVVSGTGPGEKPKYNADDLRKQFVQTGIQTGINPEDVAAGVQQFVTKVGDLDTAIANMKVFATTAQATGASVADIASAAADLSEKLDIKSAEDMGKALATLSVQGKKGAFELRDMAQYLPEIAAEAAKFGVKGIPGITSLGGMTQIARQATGSGAEAATAMQAMFRQLTVKSADMQSGAAFGGRKVQVFEASKEMPEGDPTKDLRDFRDILADTITASRGNLVQLQEVFDIRGIRAVNPLIKTFREASKKAGGGEKGAKAGREAILKQISASSDVNASFSDIQHDATQNMKSFSVQMEVFHTRIKSVVASQIFPELVKLAPKLVELVPYVEQATKVFVELVKWIADHPKTSIAMLIGGQILADFARARLGALVASLIDRAFSGKIGRVGSAVGGSASGGAGSVGGSIGGGTSTGGTTPGGKGGGFMGVPSVGGMLGAAGTGLAIGLPIAAGIYTSGIASVNASEASMRGSGSSLNEIRELSSVEDISRAREIVEEQRRKVREVTLDNQGVTGWVSNAITGGQGEVEQKTQEKFLTEMEERLRKLLELGKIAEDFRKAGTDNVEASKRIAEAAQKMGLQSPNRGPVPSPIKGG